MVAAIWFRLRKEIEMSDLYWLTGAAAAVLSEEPRPAQSG